MNEAIRRLLTQDVKLESPQTKIQILEEIRKVFAQQMRQHTLQKLSYITCLRLRTGSSGPDNIGYHEEDSWFPSSHANTRRLQSENVPTWEAAKNIRGIFYYKPKFRHRVAGITPTTGYIYIFGLTKDGEWIYAKIDFEVFHPTSSRYEDIPLSITIVKTSIEKIMEIFEISFEEILQFLADTVHQWRKNREKLLYEIQELETGFEQLSFFVQVAGAK